MSVEEYEAQITELKKTITNLQAQVDIYKQKVEYCIGCFDSLQKGMKSIIETTEIAKNGVV